MRIINIAVFILLLLGSCSGDKHNFKVKVSVTGNSGGVLHLARRTLTGTVAVDSAKPDRSGTYVLKGKTAMPDFFILYYDLHHYINLIINPGDDFRVRTEIPAFENSYLVEGSKDSRLIQKMVSMQAKTLVKITEISTAYENGMGQPGFDKLKIKIDSTYKKIVSEHRDFSVRLIRENPHSLASLMALYQQLGKNMPVFDYRTDFKIYHEVDSNLSALFPQSDAVRDLNRKVTELGDRMRLDTGAVAPAISMPDTNGKIQSLENYRGSYVLLVFWASWSSPSCEAVRKILPMVHKQSSKGLILFMVSLDRSRDSWMKQVDEIKADGVQVCDMKYWDSPLVETYRINQVPVVYLLDKNGRIIYKNINPDELPAMLEKL